VQLESRFDSGTADCFQTNIGQVIPVPIMTMDKDEVQGMIDMSIAKAMRKHNRNATVISACLGILVLAFYSHGLIAVVEKLTK
jgi:hypothetical protein